MRKERCREKLNVRRPAVPRPPVGSPVRDSPTCSRISMMALAHRSAHGTLRAGPCPKTRTALALRFCAGEIRNTRRTVLPGASSGRLLLTDVWLCIQNVENTEKKMPGKSPAGAGRADVAAPTGEQSCTQIHFPSFFMIFAFFTNFLLTIGFFDV